MRKTLFLFLLIFARVGLGVPPVTIAPYTIDVAMGTNNLAATYSTSFPQLALSAPYVTHHLAILNRQATGICCDVQTYSTSVAPSVSNGRELCVPGNYAMVYDDITVTKNVYCRSQSGTISSGNFTVQTW